MSSTPGTNCQAVATLALAHRHVDPRAYPDHDVAVVPVDVLVLVAHPFGDLWVPLEEWMRIGPGPRPLVRPTAAKNAHCGFRPMVNARIGPS